jgi:hypothetical protein
VKGHFDFNSATLRMLSAPAQMLDGLVYPFYHKLLVFSVHAEHPPALAAVFPCDHFDDIISTDMHLHHLACQTDDLHKVPLAQFPSHGTEDPRTFRFPLIVDDHRSIGVEADVASVVATGGLLGPYDYSTNHRTLFEIAPWDRAFHTTDDDISDTGIAPSGTPEHLDTHELFDARVICRN